MALHRILRRGTGAWLQQPGRAARRDFRSHDKGRAIGHFGQAGLSGVSTFATLPMPGARGHAVTMAAMPFQRGIVADRILQKVCPLVRFFRRRCGRMTMGWHIRREFLGGGARTVSLVLFGTAGLSGLSAFATATPGGGR